MKRAPTGASVADAAWRYRGIQTMKRLTLNRGKTRYVVTGQFSYVGLVEDTSAMYEGDVLHLRESAATRLLEDCGLIEKQAVAPELPPPAECSKCGNESAITTYNIETGETICGNCLPPVNECAGCGHKASGALSVHKDGNRYCSLCFNDENRRNAKRAVVRRRVAT